MNIRQRMLDLVEQMSDEQLEILLPLAKSLINNQANIFSNETSHAYANWVGDENDIYDEVFADDLAAR
jgi:hypothetical protein